MRHLYFKLQYLCARIWSDHMRLAGNSSQKRFVIEFITGQDNGILV